MKKYIKNKKTILTSIFVSAVAVMNLFAFGGNIKNVIFAKESNNFIPKLYSTVWQDSFREGMMIPASCESPYFYDHFDGQCEMDLVSCQITISPSSIKVGESVNIKWEYGSGVKVFRSYIHGITSRTKLVYEGTTPPYEVTFTGIKPHKNYTYTTEVRNTLNWFTLPYTDGKCKASVTVYSDVFASKNGAGGGVIESYKYSTNGKFKKSNIDCGSTCSETVELESYVTIYNGYKLSAISNNQSNFVSWSGCDSTSYSDCFINFSDINNKRSAISVSATFEKKALDLSASLNPIGSITSGQLIQFSGQITNSGTNDVSDFSARICLDNPNCLSDASNVLDSRNYSDLFKGQTINLQPYSQWTATTGNHTVYICADTGQQIAESNEANNCASAPFTVASNYILNVSKAGAGTGTVSSNPAGIDCGADCSEGYNSGTTVTLTATAAFGSDFAGWSGACSGTGNCAVTMDADKSVAATFNPETCDDAGCGTCSESCGGGTQSCVRADCSTYSQACNTQACPTSSGSNWKEVAP